MSGCTITPITTGKACSGKCKGNVCGATPRIWVIAASEGMISLFEKDAQGSLLPLPEAGKAVLSSLEEFHATMDKTDAMDQLIIVGGTSDIAWIHASLPPAVTRQIVAEVNYPLLSSWFKQPLPMPTLTRMLQAMFDA